jgi:hypothetical protein
MGLPSLGNSFERGKHVTKSMATADRTAGIPPLVLRTHGPSGSGDDADDGVRGAQPERVVRVGENADDGRRGW